MGISKARPRGKHPTSTVLGNSGFSILFALCPLSLPLLVLCFVRSHKTNVISMGFHLCSCSQQGNEPQKENSDFLTHSHLICAEYVLG